VAAHQVERLALFGARGEQSALVVLLPSAPVTSWLRAGEGPSGSFRAKGAGPVPLELRNEEREAADQPITEMQLGPVRFKVDAKAQAKMRPFVSPRTRMEAIFSRSDHDF
jgi:hypothetical protein